ncbi:hypothetical protein BpHYR1_053907 [Brachionus plicatilis]|uniref:Uncharacterized protein n=1 Tax=Brachionus plicatilis TaxID=10195 RepID=A0A3M7T6G2_BRAPC|nr:hypothetical protein BpHYR1_053907 [Brachionus plicatilis]
MCLTTSTICKQPKAINDGGYIRHKSVLNESLQTRQACCITSTLVARKRQVGAIYIDLKKI